MRIHLFAAALFVTLLPLPALALGLGAPQGSAWIGQPLDLRVPLALDGEDAGSLCAQADLRQGEAAQASTGTRAVVEPGATPDRPILRVRSARAIDEPVLHLRVSVGCQGSTSRDFVLLADPPPVLAAVPPPAARPLSAASPALAGRDANAPPVARRPVARSGAGGPAGDAARGPRPGRSGQSQAVPAPARRPAAAAAAPSKAAAPRASAPVAPSGRLKLDALEPLPPAARPSTAGAPAADRPPTAESPSPVPAITVPLAVPVPVPAAGAPTAAATAPSPAPAVTPVPSETLAEVQRTTQLEAALAELRAQARQNQQTLAELRAELADARDNRYSNPLVYALLLLVLMAAAALWALWRIARRTPESPWAPAPPKPGLRSRFARRRASARPDTDDDESSQPPLYFPTAVSRRGQLPGADDEEEDEGFPDTENGGRGGVWDRAERAAASPAIGRALAVDELFDVQQQAEFFTSLGQHDQAIDALRHYVNEHPQASALAYLELLHLYHQLQRESEYEQLRQQCEDALNVRVPGFLEFGAVGGRTLEQYPEARARLQSHWPHPETLEVIEELLFRRGKASAAEAFDLAAYRELLMLYALVQEQQFADGQAWPSLDDLLRLPRPDGAAATAAARAGVRAAPPGGPALAMQGAVNDPFDRVLDPQRGDFQPTWPPALDQELDMDLARLEAQQINTIPLALHRPSPAPDTLPETLPLEMPAAVLDGLSLAPRQMPHAPTAVPARPENLSAAAGAAAADAGKDEPRSTQPVSASLRR